jgi:hypothetical protein
MTGCGRELPVEAPSGSCLIADTGNTSGVWLRVAAPPPRRVFTIRKGIDMLLGVLGIDPSV